MSPANHEEPLGPLPDVVPGSPLETEWNLYRTQRPRLIAEGQEGRYVLIKGEQIHGIFDSRIEALRAATLRFGLSAVLIHQVARQEPILRAGNSWRCPA